MVRLEPQHGLPLFHRLRQTAPHHVDVGQGRAVVDPARVGPQHRPQIAQAVVDAPGHGRRQAAAGAQLEALGSS